MKKRKQMEESAVPLLATCQFLQKFVVLKKVMLTIKSDVPNVEVVQRFCEMKSNKRNGFLDIYSDGSKKVIYDGEGSCAAALCYP